MSKPTILIADDSLSHLRLMEIMLAPAGYTLISFDHGIEVLEYLQGHTPDLIILDIEMPILSGLELCARIKGVSRLAEVPVLLVTSLRGPRVATDGQLVHADAVLEKPLGVEWFRQTVKRYLPVPAEATGPGAGSDEYADEPTFEAPSGKRARWL